MTDARPASPVVNAMSVDVEDYYQVQALSEVVARARWDSYESRVERNVDALLSLFAETGTRATFFTLGCVAERHPAMIRRIVGGGHELASHGWAHFRADAQTPEQFRDDVRRTRATLEDIGGVRVAGYRAASFSIGSGNLWALGILAEEGYTYSSSIYPVRHDIYGMPGAPRTPFRPVPAAPIVELPLSTHLLFGRRMPASGGGYFRLLPYSLSRWALTRVNAEARPAIFYFHPWEIDADQPRQRGLSLKSRVRHYTNLARMRGKLQRLLRDFRWDRMDRVFSAEIASRSRLAA